MSATLVNANDAAQWGRDEEWGRDEASLSVARYWEDIEDGESHEQAIEALIRRRNHAMSYIDVPVAWLAYRDALIEQFPIVAER